MSKLRLGLEHKSVAFHIFGGMQASIWLFMLICLTGAHGKIPLSRDDKPRRVFENGTERVFDKDQSKPEEAGQEGTIDQISDEVEVSVVLVRHAS